MRKVKNPRVRGLAALLAFVAGVAVTASADEPRPLARAEGYVGCWYSIGTTKDEYKYKYSGGMANYPQQHAPFAIYDKTSNKTFFVYGGADPARKSILAHPGFYALWADGDARAPSESRLYFTDKLGSRVWRLPVLMPGDSARPGPIEYGNVE